MIPYAGDELTELIVQQYLVDFQTAEKMKLASSSEDEVTYEDIMSISHTIPSKEIWELVAPTVEKITSELCCRWWRKDSRIYGKTCRASGSADGACGIKRRRSA